MSDGPSEVSFARYTYSLERLKTLMKIEDPTLKWLKKTDSVIGFIEGLDYSLNYKKSFIIAIVSLLKLQKTLKKELAIYRKKQDEMNGAQNEIYKKQLMSKSETEKFMSWPDVLKVQKAVPKDTLEYVLVSLYTLQAPMRLDYTHLKIVDKDPVNISGNYLVMDENPHFIFSQYKTAKKYGTITKPVPRPLLTILKKYIKDHPTDELFPISENTLSTMIGDVFMKYGGKRVTCQILRKSYVTWVKKDDKSIAEMEELSKDMLHGVGVSNIYRRLDA
jgi:integrase